MHLPLALSFKPGSQAFEMDRSLRASAPAWGDHGIGLIIFIVWILLPDQSVLSLSTPAYLADSFLALLRTQHSLWAPVLFVREKNLSAIGRLGRCLPPYLLLC